MGQADFSRWLDDYVSDLTGAGFGECDVRIACTNWRTSEAKKMPTPGELLAYCRKVFRPEKAVAVIEPLPPRPKPTAEERDYVRQGLQRLACQLDSAGHINFRELSRRPGETGAEQGMRLWPSRRVDSRGYRPTEALDDII